MKKTGIGWALLLGLALGTAGLTAKAETYYGDENWNVTFTAEEKMESSFKTQDMDDVINGLQPGDNAIITLTLCNQHAETTDWYMTNKVLYSLEDRSNNENTSGGAYTYVLDYVNPEGETTNLFNSDTVGGDTVGGGGEGLHEATDALDDFFYLDTLANGENGRIVLEVALDGETQGNDYQDTLADLQMNFAVELNRVEPSNTWHTAPGEPGVERDRIVRVVQTGDENLPLPLLFGMCLSGLALLVLACIGLRMNRKQAKEDS